MQIKSKGTAVAVVVVVAQQSVGGAQQTVCLLGSGSDAMKNQMCYLDGVMTALMMGEPIVLKTHTERCC